MVNRPWGICRRTAGQGWPRECGKSAHLHAAPLQVDGRGAVKALRRLTEQRAIPALQQKPLFALGTSHSLPSRSSARARATHIWMRRAGYESKLEFPAGRAAGAGRVPPAFLVFAAPQRCADALQAGLRLCGRPLLVSLFPFLIVSALAAGCGAGQWLGFVFRPAARLMGIRAKGAGGVLLIGASRGFAPAACASKPCAPVQLTSRQCSALLPACVQRAVLCHPHGRAADAGQPRG